MARYSGRDLYATFSGTAISPIRSIDVDEPADDIDASAASDARKVHLAGLIDGNVNIEALDDTANNNVYTALAPQSQATLIFGPRGTNSGRERQTGVATVIRRQRTLSYRDVVPVNADLRLDTALTEDTWP